MEIQTTIAQVLVVEVELRQHDGELVRARAMVDAERQCCRDLFDFAPDACSRHGRERRDP